MDTNNPPSAALLAANRQLHRLRADAQTGRCARTAVAAHEQEAPPRASVPERAPNAPCDQAAPPGIDQAEAPALFFPRENTGDAASPLGWESQALTDHLRHIEARKQAEAAAAQRQQQVAAWLATIQAKLAATTHLRDSIPIFGHTLDVIGRAGREGDGRVWLLARYLDQARGEGRVALDDLRHKLVNEWQILSWKRLRQIMNAGEGIFWHRDKKGAYLYYHSEARVARAFGVGQLRGLAVAVPVKDLLRPIKHVRALFYDAFHSAREEGFGNPITRLVMENRGNGDGRTQREYEDLRGIETKANYVNVCLYDKARLAWEKGREDEMGVPLGPAFVHVDYDGRLGHNPNRRHRRASQRHWHNIYIMRRMANSYNGTLSTVKRGQKWTNRKLENLCYSMHTLSTGSFEEDESVQIYHSNEEKADRFHRKRRDDVDAYYPQAVAQAAGESDVWRVRSPGEVAG